MPIGEKEIHPYLEQGHINGAKKLILGSFPVYECTNPDNELKRRNRQIEGTFRFFYGSNKSKLWKLYFGHFHDLINLSQDPILILQSLAQHQIAITDTIISCQRREYSSEDSKLSDKTFNRQGIQTLIQNGVTKILCTSKGVLNDLELNIICSRNNAFGKIDNTLSANFQADFVTELGGNNEQITNSIAKIFTVDNIQITALAIPSPGSPQRQLAQFGFDGLDWQHYANNYFFTALNWLNQ